MKEFLDTGQYTGLSSAEAEALRRRYGLNKLTSRPKTLWQRMKPFLADPLLVLLVVAALLYFALGRAAEGSLMLTAIALVSSVSYFQERRSSRALRALRELVEPRVRVVRDGQEREVLSAMLVPGDLIRLSEGDKVPADAQVLTANDLSANESLLTGESFSVTKTPENADLFQGTLINSGACLARVVHTGMKTRLGQLGALVDATPQPRSALKAATTPLVRLLSGLGIGSFTLIFLLNFFRSYDFLASLLYGLTLAMAAIPEEIPVAFTTFMALGAARLSRRGVLTRNPQTIENLGAVTVICLDKTGTLTENRMQLRFVYDAASRELYDLNNASVIPERPVRMGALASETAPFDEMEKAILESYQRLAGPAARSREIVHEHPLAGTPPMMTHLYTDGDAYLAAAKGAPEKILSVCRLGTAETAAVLKQVEHLATQGFRVLGVASAPDVKKWLPAQEDYPFRFEGLLALYDPPKKEAPPFIEQMRAAGIRPMLLTGDYPETARHIASAVGITVTGTVRSSADVLDADDARLDAMTRETNLFARMTPEAKGRVIVSLKRQGAFVAMTGDGVNDAPAIRLAHVGIAMGHRGTEFSRQAADLVLTDDKLTNIVRALEEGRKILQNLRKVTSYILALHIPIFMLAVVPLLLQWRYQNIFSPTHVIFLELIMGPTCSLFYEGDAAAADTMFRPPKDLRKGILGRRDAWRAVVQGVAIGGGLLWLYHYLMPQQSSTATRTAVFLGLLFANLLLTFVNRSFSEPIWRSWRRPNRFRYLVPALSISFCLVIVLLPGLRKLFELTLLPASTIMLACGTAVVSVLWQEPLKAIRKRPSPGAFQPKGARIPQSLVTSQTSTESSATG
ncbi:cation-translocating P-type ATPase [Flaviaesturariibacter flavus]|uniref:Cation-translocating P-type ATPase n=1 Tax=Flaviaesturariibacter flavus TaxID=2502780 RepID=A0A4R1BNB3_9BACT|nr:cation-translocating P-type ATPase [Flaviaesturariibacter flavus]TCJ19090.1 cation-translocating P-type ATPase [Flaviaesturariibacter flavus]